MKKFEELLDIAINAAFAIDEYQTYSAARVKYNNARAALLNAIHEAIHAPVGEHIPFDLERAKAGDPIEASNDGKIWFDTKFIGMTSKGDVVMEGRAGDIVRNVPSRVRMKVTEMRTVYVNQYRSGTVYAHLTEGEALGAAGGGNCVTVAYPVRIPKV